MADDALGVWEPFDVETVQALMAGAEMPWWLSGGLALDTFVGRTTRAHGDIDISVRRSDWPVFRRFTSTRLALRIARDGMLFDVPDAPLDDEVHGLWARELNGGPWRLQVNLEPVDGTEWVYRRDARIRRPVDDVVWRRGSLPYGNPAVQLLWKAKDCTAKDEHDFANVVPRLPSEERRWLAQAVAISHPDSPWLARLAAAPR